MLDSRVHIAHLAMKQSQLHGRKVVPLRLQDPPDDAGTTGGAGRGIARALGEAGAIVYCTGRSVRGQPSPYKRPETIDETAEMINAAGGAAIAVRVDHTMEKEVEALFARVDREQGRLDVLVNCIAGEEPMMKQYTSFWKATLEHGAAIFEQALLSHIITARHAAPLMIRARSGLIVEVTESDILSAGGNPLSQSVKLALKGLALNMAAELEAHGVAAIAITPGFLRSEACSIISASLKPTGATPGRRTGISSSQSRRCLSAARSRRWRGRARARADGSALQLVGARARYPIRRCGRPAP
jgi:NAD(P)-dependent dehydrogenase (short-subunit alcohol dehydrogenase family)